MTTVKREKGRGTVGVACRRLGEGEFERKVKGWALGLAGLAGKGGRRSEESEITQCVQ